jgi:hypothetical protein
MSWPLSQDYNEAVQDPLHSFNDPELHAGEAAVNALGLPMPRSGNFADVYEFRCPQTGNTWALKCFTRHVPSLQMRYAEISQHLAQANLSLTVDFTYLHQGIRVRGEWYPLLKMRWVEGFTLNEFVRNHLDKPKTLEVLCELWRRVGRRLREASIAHGDLQHGNVLLVPGIKGGALKVRLIDYDGMWVPTLASTPSGEIGHPAYQHPQRLREGTYCPEVDRFPLVVIYTALRALCVGGRALWEKYDNGDNLLFREADLRNPRESALFRELIKLNSPEVASLADCLSRAAYKPIDQTPLLEQVAISEKALPPSTAQDQLVTALPAQSTSGAVSAWQPTAIASSAGAAHPVPTAPAVFDSFDTIASQDRSWGPKVRLLTPVLILAAGITGALMLVSAVALFLVAWDRPHQATGDPALAHNRPAHSTDRRPTQPEPPRLIATEREKDRPVLTEREKDRPLVTDREKDRPVPTEREKKAPNVLELLSLENPNGLSVLREVDCSSQGLLVQIGPQFDIKKSWSLSLELLIPDYQAEQRLPFIWGDERPGRDPIYVRQEGTTLFAVIQNSHDNSGDQIKASLKDIPSRQWISVLFAYVNPPGDLLLYLDGKLIERKVATASPTVDRPMPIGIGGGYMGGKTPTFQRFKGKIRNLRLGNLEVKAVEQLQKVEETEHNGLREALQTLAARPDDADANQWLGEFYCFHKGSWDRGLPSLAKGTDPGLKALAQKELKSPATLDLLREVADAWWNRAQETNGVLKAQLQRHAYWRYLLCLPGRDASDEAEIDLRLRLLGEQVPGLEGPLDALDLSRSKFGDGGPRLEPGQELPSRRLYSGPVEIDLVARTDARNIRLRAHRGSAVIFNWEAKAGELRVQRPDGNSKTESGSIAASKPCPLTPLVWYHIRWFLTEAGMVVSVDDVVVFQEKRRYDLSGREPIRVAAADCPIEVQSFSVKRLK